VLVGSAAVDTAPIIVVAAVAGALVGQALSEPD
jgi:hypothetical protein